MEVHHHAHTARKKWTHYIWEFLMLFLAVFCGFLAEYQLEHTIEKQREDRYMQSMVADLKADTMEVRSVIEFNVRKFHGLDTFITQLEMQELNEQNETDLYRLNRLYAANIYTFIFSDHTMRQLLSSGTMRLIRSQAISDSILGYYGQPKDDISAQEMVYREMSMRLVIHAEDIFDKAERRLRIKSDNNFYWEYNANKIGLMTRDRKVLKKYAQMVANTQSMLAVYLQMLLSVQEKSKKLLFFLEKEYNLK